MSVSNIAPAQLADWLSDAARSKPVLLDVREPWEFQTCHIENARLVPLRELQARVAELDPAAETVLICHHGGRSMQAALFLQRNGFARVHNLAGGVDAWARSVDPAMPVY
jgi:rhodanese-related sulfurtransferase